MGQKKDKQVQERLCEYCSWGKECVDDGEKLLIATGPKSRFDDLKRLSRIMMEFIRGFHTFRKLGPCITFFGSARFAEDHDYYTLARETARIVGNSGFSIMTGGGPGIMEASNRGAKDVGAHSLGCNITLPKEQEPNSYLDRFVEFNYFYVRKVMLLRYSYGFVVFPGGFGTLDEVFETITLIQTKKILGFPIVMMGVDYWKPLKEFIFNTLLKNATISHNDLTLIYFTDSPTEAIDYINGHVKNSFGQ